MKERKIPTRSWIEKSKNEIEREEELLVKRMELLNDIRIKKMLYEDSEAFKVGYEAGFAKACDMLHDFAEMVYRMRWAQSDELAARDNKDIDNEMAFGNCARVMEAEVDTWISENYPHLMEEENVNG